MKIDLFKLGPLTVHSYGFLIGIGFIVALLIGEIRAKKKKLNSEAVVDLGIIAVVTGFLGGKILFIIVSFSDFIKNPVSVLGSAGFVVYGGIILATICCLIYCKVKKLDFFTYFDFITPLVAIAQGFGRMGCFMAGCCYGRQTDSAIGVVFPVGGMAPSGVKLIPTQLFSSAGDFIIAIVLIFIADKVVRKDGEWKMKQDDMKLTHVPGDIGCLYLLLYGIGRFVIEIFRNDVRGSVGVLSTSQFISIFMVIGSICFCIINRKMHMKRGN